MYEAMLAAAPEPPCAAPVPPPAELVEMGRRLLTDLKENDHYTADPLFTVQRKRLVIGIDPKYASNIGWFDEEYSQVTDPDELARIEAHYYENYEAPEGYSRTGYTEEWVHIDTYLTPQAARERIANESDMRVCVESAYRIHEMKLIRQYLMDLARAADDSASTKQEDSNEQ